MQIDPDASQSLFSAAESYRDECGWLVYPLHGPSGGGGRRSGTAGQVMRSLRSKTALADGYDQFQSLIDDLGR